VKFKDAELIGAPIIVVVGRGLVEGKVEVKTRSTGASEDVALDGNLAATIKASLVQLGATLHG
jgi:prolyl-tRNA synthetase